MQASTISKLTDYTAIWQQYMPKVAWGTLALAAAIALGYYLTITSALEGSLSYGLASVFCSYLAFASFTVVHDAGHGGIFSMDSKLKFVGDILGWIYAVPLLLVPYRFFQKIHDRHHAFTNDPERDPDYFGGSKTWYGVVLKALAIPFKYHYMGVTKLRHNKIFRDTYPSTILYMTLVHGSLLALAINGYAQEVIFFALIPLFFAVIILALFFDFFPHYPHKALGRYQNTRIFIGRIWNVLLFGQNYHLIHHMYPRLPWYTYQSVYRKMEPHLVEKGAPIEDSYSEKWPDFMKSSHAHSLQDDGEKVDLILSVSKVEKLTPDAVAISLALPSDQALKYKAGQYITVSKWLNHDQQTRCYSLCEMPGSGVLKIGVRATANGLMSGYLNTQVKVGDELIVQGPFGDFVYPPLHESPIDQLVLIAGGSGITPILSILETALLKSVSEKPDLAADIPVQQRVNRVTLIYACRSVESVMFLARTQELMAQYPERLTVHFIIDEARPAFGIEGRLKPGMMTRLLEESVDQQRNHAEYYICGPQALKDMAESLLKEREVKESRVHIEQFVSTLPEPEGQQYDINVALADGLQHQLKVASNQTVLEVAKSEGIKLPHACGHGTCGTCKFKVEEGRVSKIPSATPGITIEEQDAGYTLACQCKPMENLRLSEIRG